MRDVFRRALPSLLSVLLALVICFIGAAITLQSPLDAGEAFLNMFWGAFGDFPRFIETGVKAALLRPWGEAGTKAAMLTFTGLSVAIAFRVGLFNIGSQGQLMVGAITAAIVGTAAMPSGVHLVVCLLCAAATGALYALIPAVLKLTRGVHEVISTIMLNWVASSLIENWLVVGPFKASASGDNSIPGTAQIQASAQLPLLLGDLSRLNLGFVLAVVVALVTAWFMSRTTLGFEWRAVGLNHEAARTAGIPVGRRMLQAMALAGAFSGLAGAVLILGTELRYPSTIASAYGFDGITVSLIGQNNPIGVLLTALFFGGLRAGGTRMQLWGVHKSFPELIQGVALLLVAAKLLWERVLRRRAKKAVTA